MPAGPVPPAASRSLVYWLHRPYFDLGAVDEAPLSSYGPLVALADLDGSVGLGMQHCYGERFRVSLLRESGLAGYGAGRPDEVSDDLRTEPWRRLCKQVERFASLGDKRPNIPLTMFEVSDMGNRVSTPNERTNATQALTTWRSDHAALFEM